jgi:serine/threonine-protein kinase SRPK3
MHTTAAENQNIRILDP